MAAVSALTGAIRDGDLQLPLPQSLPLPGGELLHCEQLLRLLPGKRGVFKARYRERSVLAKIFLDSAARQVAREQAGYERLFAAQQPTPQLIASIAFDGGSVLLFEFLSDAQPLFREDAAPDAAELARLLDRLQSMYAAGVYHGDLHWGNFLWRDGTAYVIDAAAVLGDPPQKLGAGQVADNLGILIAQFRRCDQGGVREAVLAHTVCAQFGLSEATIAAAAEKHWQQRRQALLQKCFRDSTATHCVHSLDRVYAYRRAYAGPDLDAFLQNPDSAMAGGEVLKLGNSATVVKLPMDGRHVVVKRYNMKNALHWLRRCWRPSRAWTSWRNAHWLELLGLHTPPPIAFLEMRSGPLRRRAYYVSEFVEGTILADELNRREPSALELAELEKYFTVAAREHLVHGDMKATNFLLQNERLVILDLDAMRATTGKTWQQGFRCDFERFERNWTDRPVWLQRLQNRVAGLLV